MELLALMGLIRTLVLRELFVFCHVCCAHARFYEFGHVSKFNELFNGIALYPEEGSIAETSAQNILQSLFYNILNSHTVYHYNLYYTDLPTAVFRCFQGKIIIIINKQFVFTSCLTGPLIKDLCRFSPELKDT